MTLDRHAEVRNVMPGGLGGHLGRSIVSFVDVISWCLNDRHHRKRLEPARYCCCPVRELPLGLLLGPVHFIGVWSWVQWRGRVSAVSLVFASKSGLEPTSQKSFQLHATETDCAREWLNRTGARFPRGPRERTSFIKKGGSIYLTISAVIATPTTTPAIIPRRWISPKPGVLSRRRLRQPKLGVR